MKAFVCLAISCLLVGLLYVYVRQQFAMQTSQISQLTYLIRSMAVPDKVEVEPIEVAKLGPDRIDVSDDSESDDTDSESSSTECEPILLEECCLSNVMEILGPDVTVIKPEMKVVEPEIVGLEIIGLEPVEETAKKIVIAPNYEQWSLKDLKEQISKMGGPTLKTKKLMVEFLEKNAQ